MWKLMHHGELAIIEPLLEGTKKKLLSSGVKESNIVVQSVPGSWELPIACSKCVSLHAHYPQPYIPSNTKEDDTLREIYI